MYKGFSKDVLSALKRYASKFVKWARTPVEKIKVFYRR